MRQSHNADDVAGRQDHAGGSDPLKESRLDLLQGRFLRAAVEVGDVVRVANDVEESASRVANPQSPSQ